MSWIKISRRLTNRYHQSWYNKEITSARRELRKNRGTILSFIANYETSTVNSCREMGRLVNLDLDLAVQILGNSWGVMINYNVE